MRRLDAEKITMNLNFLQENTVNTMLLMEKLTKYELLSESDRRRILDVPDYDRNMEVYLSVILCEEPQVYRKLLDCLRSTGNDAAFERLTKDSAIDYAKINAGFWKHWPFSLLFVLSNVVGFLYWIYRAQEFLYRRK